MSGYRECNNSIGQSSFTCHSCSLYSVVFAVVYSVGYVLEN